MCRDNKTRGEIGFIDNGTIESKVIKNNSKERESIVNQGADDENETESL